MRDAVSKLLPLASGAFLGWLIFNPPSWLAGLGPLSYLAGGLLALVLLVGLVALLILASLPRELRTEPVAEDEVPADLHRLAEQYAQLGFRRAGPALRVHVAPSAILLGFVHETEPVYGTVFRTGTIPPKTSCDLVSILHGDRGGLTTNADPNGAVLPAGHESLRQVFPGASLPEMLRRHLEGLAYLKQRGIPPRPVSADTFRRDFLNAMRKQRECFLRAPLRGAVVTLWRSATKQVPFRGSLREQSIAQRQIPQLLGG